MNPPTSPQNNGMSMLRGIAWTSVDRWVCRILNIAVIALLARLLDRTDFGLVAVAALCVDYFKTFVGQGLGLAIIQRKDLEPEHLNAAFWISIGFATGFVMLIWAAAPYLAEWLKAPAVSPVLRWLSLVLILQALSWVHMALLTRRMRFAPIAAANLSASVAGAAVGLSLAFLGYGVWSLVAQQLIHGMTARIVIWWVTDWKPGFKFSLRHVRDLYGYSLYVFADQQMLFVARRLDEGLIAGFMGVADLGLYSIAKRMVILLHDLLETPLSQVLFPGFSRLQGSVLQLADAAERSYRFACLFVMPAFAGLFALAPEAVNLFFGGKWGEATPFVQMLAIGAPFFLFPLITHSVFKALGRPGIPLGLNTGRAVAGAVLLPLGALFGPLGIPAALSLRNMVGGIADAIFFRRKVPALRIPLFPGLYRPVFAAVVMAFSARIVADVLEPMGILLQTAGGVCAGVLVYMALIYLIDRDLIKNVIRLSDKLIPQYFVDWMASAIFQLRRGFSDRE
jgi:O-antigen/teichoic acid export membrane protein